MGVFGRFADWRLLGRTPEELDHLVCRLPAPVADAVPQAEAPKGWALERRLPPEVIGQVEDNYRNGATCRELAQEHGVSVSAMEALLKRRGVELRGAHRRPKLTGEQEAEAVARYAEGASSYSVGTEYGVSMMTVMKLVREAGVRVHGTWPDPATLATAEELYRDGLSVERVAAELGFTKTTMLRAMKQAGIRLRPKGRRPSSSSL
jgi:transposase